MLKVVSNCVGPLQMKNHFKSRHFKNGLFFVQFSPMADKDQWVSFNSKFYAYFKILVAIPKISAFESATTGNVNHLFLIKFI